jgi:nucleoside-diphosphate-sugar epimerase
VSASRKSFTKESKILLLGGGGYIGTHLFQKLKSQGYSEVTIGSRSVSEIGGLKVDIEHPSSIKIIRDGRFDFIINLTGQISRPIESCLNQNTLGIQHILAACSDFSTLVHLSSVGVYGSGEYADESSPCNPETPYSTLKRVAENLVIHGLPDHQRLVVRLSNIYGSSQPKGVFAYLKRSALSDRRLEFNNDGSLVRFFLHVEDLAAGLIALLHCNSEIQSSLINMVGKDRFSVLELIGLFEEKFQGSYHKEFEPVSPYDNLLSISDQIFRNMTNFKEQFSLTTYINDLLTYAD